MSRIVLAGIALLVLGVTAHADLIVVGLEASPPAGGGECYAPGEMVNIDVWYHSQFDIGAEIKLSQFSNLAMPEIDRAGFSPMSFSFVQTPEPEPPYGSFPEWPMPSAGYIGMEQPPPGVLAVIEPMEPFHVGSFSYTLADHDVLLDIINHVDADPDLTGRLRANWDPVLDLTPMNGGLTGGTLELCVIPEPAGLTLLALGALLACRRRR